VPQLLVSKYGESTLTTGRLLKPPLSMMLSMPPPLGPLSFAQ
jgi:hypothetical protein